jgi:glucose/arabinose dehydrogenase
MKTIATALLIALLAIGLVACDSKPTETTAAPEATAPSAESAPTAPDEPAKVEVSAEGTTFKPPVQKAQLPDNVYYCDMGTVHYARSEKGDNKCPLCNMFLTPHNVPGAEAPPAQNHGHGHGHGHDHDHDHDHDHNH